MEYSVSSQEELAQMQAELDEAVNEALATLPRLLSRTANLVVNIPIVRGVNRFLGGVMGLFNAAIMALCVTALAWFVITLWGDTVPFLNTQTIESSYLFRFVLDHNILLQFTEGLFAAV